MPVYPEQGSGSGGITELTGDVIAGPGTGAQAAEIPDSVLPSWTTATAPGNVQDLAAALSMSGASQAYRFGFSIVQNGAGTPNFTLQPNSVATNAVVTGYSRYAAIPSPATPVAWDDTEAFIGGGNPAGTRVVGQGTISQVGGVAQIEYSFVVDDGAGAWIEKGFVNVLYYGGELTSFRVHATAATSIATGSVLRMAKVN